jgi:hypothetical protein
LPQRGPVPTICKSRLRTRFSHPLDWLRSIDRPLSCLAHGAIPSYPPRTLSMVRSPHLSGAPAFTVSTKTPLRDLKTDDPRVAMPLYTISDAARALGVPATTLATWARGYVRRPPGRAMYEGEPVVTAFPSRGPSYPSVPFVGLVEGMVLAAIRSSGVPLQRIRPALEALSREFGVSHALA